MSDTLYAALATLFDETQLSTSFTGGYHLWKASKGTLDKYCVATPIAAPNTAGYGNASIVGEFDVQFAAWARGAADALTLIRLAMTTIDAAALPLTGGKRVCLILRMTNALPMDGSGDDSDDGDEMFGWSVTYRFAIS